MPHDLAPAYEATAEPIAIAALAERAPRWRQWAGPVLSLALVGAVLERAGGLNLRHMAAMLPANPLFWLCLAGAYCAQPGSEWLIFRRLWRLPPGGFLALLRKQVGNEVLLGYIGEAYFYAWARRRPALAKAPFGAVKDVTILSALAGNLATLLAVALCWPLIKTLPAGLHLRPMIGSILFAILLSLAAMLFRGRLFSSAPRDLTAIMALHLARIGAATLLTATMWHLLMPQVALGTWALLATLRLLVSRLPLIPNKDLVFAGLALLVGGRGANPGNAIALIAGLMLIGHLAVGLSLGIGDAAANARGGRPA